MLFHILKHIITFPLKCIPHKPYQRAVFYFLWTLLALSWITSPYIQHMKMQHELTIILILLISYCSNRFHISNTSFTALALFAVVHIIGGRYVYINVPYDQWSEYLLGMNITETFGLKRNMFDRITHFTFGLLWVVWFHEIEYRHRGITYIWAAICAIGTVLAISAAYEIYEYWIVFSMPADIADMYVAKQGDHWDTEKDMALAGIGALLSMTVLVPLHYLRQYLR